MTPRIGGWLLIAALVSISCAPADNGGSAGASEAGPTLRLTSQASGTTALLQAVSPVSEAVVWVSGHEGMYAMTTDGGASWSAASGPAGDSLQFRDVEAFDASTAYLMSAGTGPASRIYRTDDGGVTWVNQYIADHPDAFLDCMAFWDRDRGLVYGDEVDGVPFLLSTEDGGETWTRVPESALPAAQDGEGGFAASGTCLITGEDGRAWVATGNAERARVLATADYGASWTAVDAPMVGGTGAGLTTIQMRPDGSGVALGGIIGGDSIRADNVIVTADGGATWASGGAMSMPGPVYGSAVAPGSDLVVATGPRGLAVSWDLGGSWSTLDSQTYWAAAFVSAELGWAVGPDGRIVRLATTR